MQGGSHNFTFGLLDFASYGGGFDSLTFTLHDNSNNTNLFSNSFTSLTAAQNFFTDDPLTYANLIGNADFTLTYSLTASSIKGSGMDFLVSVAPVPLPAAAWLFGSGLLGFAGFARRRPKFQKAPDEN